MKQIVDTSTASGLHSEELNAWRHTVVLKHHMELLQSFPSACTQP